MKTAIMGTGGVGGYFGAKLALGGHDVCFVARGAHLDAIKAKGLRVESPLGNMHLGEVDATDDPSEIGAVDVVLIAVKLWDTETATEACRPLVKDNTLVIPFQNGITAIQTMTGHPPATQDMSVLCRPRSIKPRTREARFPI